MLPKIETINYQPFTYIYINFELSMFDITGEKWVQSSCANCAAPCKPEKNSHLHCHPAMASRHSDQKFPVRLRLRRRRSKLRQRRAATLHRCGILRLSETWQPSWFRISPLGLFLGLALLTASEERLKRQQASFSGSVCVSGYSDEENIFPKKVEDNQLVSRTGKGLRDSFLLHWKLEVHRSSSKTFLSSRGTA